MRKHEKLNRTFGSFCISGSYESSFPVVSSFNLRTSLHYCFLFIVYIQTFLRAWKHFLDSKRFLSSKSMYIASVNLLYISTLNNVSAKLYSFHNFLKCKDPWGQKHLFLVCSIPRAITDLSHLMDSSIIPIMEIINDRTSWEKANIFNTKRIMSRKWHFNSHLFFSKHFFFIQRKVFL